MNRPSIYIDGEVGTTGLEIRKNLQMRRDIDILSIDIEKRKDVAERKKLINACDLAILCLPDAASREAVSFIDNPSVKILDASTAHRTEPGWVYGFPELTSDQSQRIAHAKRVSNPGCYPTGAVALLRPYIDLGLIPKNYPITINAVSGYSGGGKELIALCEKPDGTDRSAPYCLYGLDQNHKHLPEMKMHAGLEHEPIFLPCYSSAFYRGMLITIALNLNDLREKSGKEINAEKMHATLAARYQGQKYVMVEKLQEDLEKTYVLTPLAQNNTNNLQLRLFSNKNKKTIILTACLDNLGKGASGAAIQNVELMLGLKN